ncbi:helix-turn-helix transcriptional regulator [Demequina pelophila]|uniref:helix-turn-helix transcriptional regulator n=1 Tax=Demequina pelophila TaxID=1638984 RepID=UPI0012DFFF91|nr:helix-turn-helix domain-containing protein [Demequina pelophila]
MTIEQVAVETGIAVPTLYKWRSTRENGPASLRIGRNVRYRRDDVAAWIDEQVAVVSYKTIDAARAGNSAAIAVLERHGVAVA